MTNGYSNEMVNVVTLKRDRERQESVCTNYSMYERILTDTYVCLRVFVEGCALKDQTI